MKASKCIVPESQNATYMNALKCKIMRYHAACATMQHALPCKRELYKPQFDTQRKGTTRPQPEGRRN